MEKPLREWTEADVTNLVVAGRTEGPSLEYKQELWGSNDKGNKDFLRDICGMANGSGGLVLVGIIERRDADGPTGSPDPEAVLGIECDNPEQILLAQEARIIDGIDLRLSVESHSILLESGRYIFAFRIPDSVAKPHRVYYQGRASFPARRERRLYELNASEVREMVMKTASRIDEAEQTIQNALTRESYAHEFPVLILAAAPIFTRNFAVNFRSPAVTEALARSDLSPGGRHPYVTPTHTNSGLSRVGLRGATLTFTHNGLLRGVFPLQGIAEEHQKFFSPIAIDIYIRGLVRACGPLLGSAKLSAPVLLGASLQVSNEVYTHYDNWDINRIRLGPAITVYPTILLETLDHDLDQQIQPICDLIHQGFGEECSPMFDDNGHWTR